MLPFNPLTRFLYLVAALFFTACTLSIYVVPLQQFMAIHYSFYFELGMVSGQLFFQSLFIFRSSFKDKYQYAYHLLTVSLLGSLLLWPVILAGYCTGLHPYFYLAYFFAVVLFMFFEHRRRLNLLQLPLFLSYTWVLYRSLILIFIL